MQGEAFIEPVTPPEKPSKQGTSGTSVFLQHPMAITIVSGIFVVVGAIAGTVYSSTETSYATSLLRDRVAQLEKELSEADAEGRDLAQAKASLEDELKVARAELETFKPVVTQYELSTRRTISFFPRNFVTVESLKDGKVEILTNTPNEGPMTVKLEKGESLVFPVGIMRCRVLMSGTKEPNIVLLESLCPPQSQAKFAEDILLGR